KEIQALLRASRVKVGGGAVDLMQLVSGHHLSSLFRARPGLRLLVVQARADGREQAVADTGGGVRVLLRGHGELVGAPHSQTSTTPTPSPRFLTSFGLLAGAEWAPTARSRTFDPRDGAHTETRTARPGHAFLVL